MDKPRFFRIRDTTIIAVGATGFTRDSSFWRRFIVIGEKDSIPSEISSRQKESTYSF